MRKLAAWTFLLLAMAVGLAVVMTDPKLKKSLDDKRRAERQAERDKADRKQQEWRDGWAKWMEDAKKKNAERAKQANEPGFDAGFRKGFMGGKHARLTITIPISAKQVESLAIRDIEEDGIPVESQPGFLRGFEAGWDFGWTSK